ncbi:unnamed protein product [Rotaria sordida]|uniref:PDZ domain-containing protein n=1 Tax=Rotaria sordida TaxID=392033 RepID=A0A815LDC2_9BILA|nr:unnamed protein product [Rotaria sordida]
MIDIKQFNYREHWQEIEITLERATSSDDTSLGFTIASSIHIPFHRHYLTPITIINISKNGLAYRDKRLELYDIILRVNNIDFTNIKHKEAVNILRKAGPEVKLLIRRLSPSINEEIKLKHNGKLGISIAGGIGKEYLENDHGIFIRNIKKSRLNTQLYNGDRLITISSMYNTFDLRFVTHDMATKYIELACKESKMITLYVGHTRPIVGIQSERTLLHESQSDPRISKDESNIAEINNTSRVVEPDRDRHSEIDDYDAICEAIRTLLGKSDASNSNEHALIISFDSDDYHRYENHGNRLKNRLLNGRCTEGSKILLEVRQEQPQVIRSTRVTTTEDLKPEHETHTDNEQLNHSNEQRPSKLHEPRLITFADQRSAQQVTHNELEIPGAHPERLTCQESRISQNARPKREETTADGDGRLRWQVD